MSTNLLLAKPEHEIAYQELVKIVGRHADSLSRLEMLAIAANMVGKLVAMQDQRTVTSEMAMEIVLKNIEHGNEQAIQELLDTKGEG